MTTRFGGESLWFWLFWKTGDSSEAPQVLGSNLHWWGFFFSFSPGWGFGSAVVSERRGQLYTPTTQDHGCTQSVPSKTVVYNYIACFFWDILFNFMWYGMCIAAAVDVVNVSDKGCVCVREGVCECVICFILQTGIHFYYKLEWIKDKHNFEYKKCLFQLRNIVKILWYDWFFSND